ncbi:MAG: ArsR family transcriptional regulator [Phycisphaerales bacterium]|nr:ArsR family transcriptional regulator [Phycisphaerales bacterium]
MSESSPPTLSSQSTVELLSQLGDGVRLRMLRVLEQHELSVGELVKVLQIPQSSGSRHLRVLSDGGWVFKRSAGPASYYRVVIDDLPRQHRTLWVTIRNQLGDDATLAEDDRRLTAVLAERMTHSEAYFGRVAGAWDDIRGELFGNGFTEHALLGFVNPDWVIADLGCGTGNATELLSPWVQHVIAVDRSPEMLDAARSRLLEHGGSEERIDFLEGDLTRLPIEDASVDAAACVLVLHHIKDPLHALREARRVLRRDNGGGMLLVVDMCEHDRMEYKHAMGHIHLGFDDDEREALFLEAGFRAVRTHKLRPGVEATGPSLFAAVAHI